LTILLFSELKKKYIFAQPGIKANEFNRVLVEKRADKLKIEKQKLEE